MQRLSQQQFDTLINGARVKPRLKRELKFKPQEIDWEATDFLVITTPAQDKGALVVPAGQGYYVAPFSGRRRLKAGASGRTKAAICDLCYTWQSGGKSAALTFPLRDETRTISIICCLNLACSQHVRGLTRAAHLSRSQLPETLSAEQRVARLEQRLRALMQRIQAELIELDEANDTANS